MFIQVLAQAVALLVLLVVAAVVVLGALHALAVLAGACVGLFDRAAAAVRRLL